MEAGVEHFGRGIDTEIDDILIVVEPSFESIALAKKIKALAGDFQKRLWAVLNKMKTDQMKTDLTDILRQTGIEVAGAVPDDPVVFSAGFEGRPIGPCAASAAAGEIIDLCMKN